MPYLHVTRRDVICNCIHTHSMSVFMHHHTAFQRTLCTLYILDQVHRFAASPNRIRPVYTITYRTLLVQSLIRFTHSSS